MKLYLSSFRIPDLKALIGLVGKQPDETRLALIPNAKDYYATRARAIKTREAAEYLEELGFIVTVIDLLDYHGNPEGLRAALLQNDLIWVRGGNTFCLREAMRLSAFDEVIKDVLAQGVVYGGESAGACVAGTDIHGVELGDDPEFAETVIWEGLHLTPHYFMPHADNEMFRDFTEQMAQDRGDDPATVILNDDQVWVESGGVRQVITGVYQLG